MRSAQIDKLLTVARAEIGTKESPPNSNKVKYNTWYYSREVSGSSYPWCAIFALWCFYTAGLVHLLWGTLNDAKRAVAEGAHNWRVLGLERGQWVQRGYQPGDAVTFAWKKNGRIDHVGIVESVSADGKILYCIEGNTAVGNDSNGGEVMRRAREIEYVVGAFRPAWEPEEEEAIDMTKAEVQALIDAARVVYVALDDVPDWGKPTVERLVAIGALRGDERGNLNLTEDLLRALVVTERVLGVVG